MAISSFMIAKSSVDMLLSPFRALQSEGPLWSEVGGRRSAWSGRWTQRLLNISVICSLSFAVFRHVCSHGEAVSSTFGCDGEHPPVQHPVQSMGRPQSSVLSYSLLQSSFLWNVSESLHFPSFLHIVSIFSVMHPKALLCSADTSMWSRVRAVLQVELCVRRLGRRPLWVQCTIF